MVNKIKRSMREKRGTVEKVGTGEGEKGITTDGSDLAMRVEDESIGWLGVAVLALVGDDEHRGIVGRPFHVFPGWATAHAAALVVPSARKKTKKELGFVIW